MSKNNRLDFITIINDHIEIAARNKQVKIKPLIILQVEFAVDNSYFSRCAETNGGIFESSFVNHS